MLSRLFQLPEEKTKSEQSGSKKQNDGDEATGERQCEVIGTTNAKNNSKVIVQ